MPDNQEIVISTLFNLPPEDAITYLKEKGYVVTQNWEDLLEEATNRAFTIAGVMNTDILKDAKDIITKGLKEGKTFNSVKNEFRARMQAKGWNPSTHRLKTIYRVNSDTAYSVGRFREQEATKDFAPYWQYIAVMDNNTRPAHRAWHRKVYRADDPVWDWLYPPNGFNCRCRVRSLTERALGRKNLAVNVASIEDGETEIGGKKFKTKIVDGNKIDVGWDHNAGKEFEKVRKKKKK